MKRETLEDEVRLLKLDNENLRKEWVEYKKYYSDKVEFVKKNMGFLFQHLEKNARYPSKCTNCKGVGTIYISPTSDMEQSNKCPTCYGEGRLWL